MRAGPLTLSGVVALAAIACAPPAETIDTAAEVAAIEAVRGQEVAALMAGDYSGAYMTDDVVLMPPFASQVIGKAAAQAWAQEFMATITVQALSYEESAITVAGDWAIERYVGTLTMAPAGGAATTETMNGIHVYRKGTDGSWKMAMDMWSPSAPPGMPPM